MSWPSPSVDSLRCFLPQLLKLRWHFRHDGFEPRWRCRHILYDKDTGTQGCPWRSLCGLVCRRLKLLGRKLPRHWSQILFNSMLKMKKIFLLAIFVAAPKFEHSWKALVSGKIVLSLLCWWPTWENRESRRVRNTRLKFAVTSWWLDFRGSALFHLLCQDSIDNRIDSWGHLWKAVEKQLSYEQLCGRNTSRCVFVLGNLRMSLRTSKLTFYSRSNSCWRMQEARVFSALYCNYVHQYSALQCTFWLRCCRGQLLK